MKVAHIARGIAVHALLITCAAAFLAPLFWLAVAAFTPPREIFRSMALPLGGIAALTFDNFRTLLADCPFATWEINSLFVASLQTVLAVLLCSLSGFVLCKHRFAGKRALLTLMLATLILPGQVVLPSVYELFFHWRMLNGYSALILPGLANSAGVLLFRQAMSIVPDELLQAGRIDGAGEFSLWWNIALPITRPMTGAFTLLAFMANWNSFLWPQIALSSESKFTLPIGLAGLLGTADTPERLGMLMAGTLLSIVPTLLLFFFLQKEFVVGLAHGALR